MTNKLRRKSFKPVEKELNPKPTNTFIDKRAKHNSQTQQQQQQRKEKEEEQQSLSLKSIHPSHQMMTKGKHQIRFWR